MGFIEDLKKGLPGLRFAIPDGWQQQEEQDRRAILLDPEHRVGWHLIHVPWRVDLRREFDDLLRRDIQRHARYGFEQHFAQVPLPAPGTPRPPIRTSDPEFSPVVSIEHVEVAGAAGLMVIRRVAYEPAMEAVVGNVLIPLGTGLCDFTAFNHTPETGHREEMLLNMALQKYPGEGTQKLAQRLGRSYFDDAQFDAQFPTHPLSCVRGALRWLIGLPAAALEISAAAAQLPPPGSEIELTTVGCAIKPPPRYVLVPQGVLPLPGGMTLLSRVILEGADDPQMLDVRQIAGVTLEPDNRQEQLLKMIQSQIEEWQQQGASQIEMSWEPVDLSGAGGPSDGQVALASQVKMLINGVVTHTVSRWLCDHDGRVYRIGVATPPYIPVAEAAADADAVLRSWRRLAQKAAAAAWLTSDLRLAPLKRGQTPSEPA